MTTEDLGTYVAAYLRLLELHFATFVPVDHKCSFILVVHVEPVTSLVVLA